MKNSQGLEIKMGIDKNGTKILLYAKSIGINFIDLATIGRQGLHVTPSALKEIFLTFGQTLQDADLNVIFEQHRGFADGLFKALAAEKIHSYDYSAYEGATHIHDMNQPIPEPYKQQYTAVLDGGSLEHVFNFPVAIKNCMEMVKVGGHFLMITPCNNFPGHGFYQFSPDLMFRIFSDENGFLIKHVLIFEDNWEETQNTWYQVVDPAHLKRQACFTNSKPTFLMVVAERTKICEIFATAPQQSFYTATWDEAETGVQSCTDSGHPPQQPFSLSPFLHPKAYIPKPLKQAIRHRLIRLIHQGYEPDSFQPFDPTK